MMFPIKCFKRSLSLITIFTGLIVITVCLVAKVEPIDKLLDEISINETGLSCSPLFTNNTSSTVLAAAQKWNISLKDHYSDTLLAQSIKNSCDNFLKKKKYFLNLSPTEDEKNLSIAFSIVTFKTASQVERLLRTIYRPWNYYCIHIDKKANEEFVSAINGLVNCLNKRYNNIISTSNRVDVKWGKMSVLTADLNCMRELYDHFKEWKYLINLTGQEFPLKTNAELVKILTAYKGANNLEGTYTRRNEDRVPQIKIPFPIIWFKGSVHVTVNRQFVAFIFESPKSKVLLNSLMGRQVPDEQFFATLNHNPQLRIPGTFIGMPDEEGLPNDPLVHFMTRYKNWGDYPCFSKKFVRGICIWGVGDLSTLVTVPHLFANKFHEDFQPATLVCLEKWYYAKVAKEVKSGIISINEAFYGSLPFVKHQYVPLGQ